jgi:hypothetical protein
MTKPRGPRRPIEIEPESWLAMCMAVHPRLGILMLDTKFPRIHGDVGNAASFDFPVRYRVVPGATPEAIVLKDPRVWIEAFITEGRALVAQGCIGLATTCGFLTLVRDQVAEACGVPVASSSLEQIAMIDAMLPPGKRVGILTISAASLSADHLKAAGVGADVPVWGVDDTEFAASILNNRTELDIERARDDLVAAAEAFVAKTPDLGALVLECTNMPPFARDIARATGLPVFSILTHLAWFHAGLRPA